MNKKGVSPIVATVLLIVLGLVLASIIFLWAKSFIAEKTEKFNEPIENSCKSDQLVYEADAYYFADDGKTYIDIVNKGNIGLYGLEVRLIGEGSVVGVGVGIVSSGRSIPTGATETKLEVSSEDLQGKEILVLPVLLGENGDREVSYTCEEAGQRIQVR